MMNHKLLEALTVVILTKDRPLYLARQFEYWRDTPCEVLVLDGSVDSVTYCSPKNFRIFKEEGNRKRLEIASKEIRTPYCIWLGDDDFLLMSGLTRALSKTLMETQTKGGAIGIYSAPREFNSKKLLRKRAHGEWKTKYSTLDSRPLDRVEKYCSRPQDRHFYSIVHSEIARRVFKSIALPIDLPDRCWTRIAATCFEIGFTYMQRTLCSNETWYLKGISERPLILESRYEAQNFQDDLVSYSAELDLFVKGFASNICYEAQGDIPLLIQMTKDAIADLLKSDFHASQKREEVTQSCGRNILRSIKSGLSDNYRLNRRIRKFFRMIYRIIGFFRNPWIPWKLVFFNQDLLKVKKALNVDSYLREHPQF